MSTVAFFVVLALVALGWGLARGLWLRRRRFEESGVSYCTAHCGIANEDQDVCDFQQHGSGRCKFRPLVFELRPGEKADDLT